MWRCSGNNIYMLKINFYPESNLKDFTEAVKVFQQIWVEDGEKITQKWEEVTGLKFIETEINAVVADLKSCSHPLTLRYSNELDIKNRRWFTNWDIEFCTSEEAALETRPVSRGISFCS